MASGFDILDEVMADAPVVAEVAAKPSVPSLVHPEALVGGSFAFSAKKFLLQMLLERTASVVPTKDIMPVLKNFQFEVAPGRLTVVATDLELSVVATTEMVEVEAPGTGVFPAKKMLDIVREAADEGDVRITVINGVAHVAVGKTAWQLKLQPGDDYPQMPDVDAVAFHPVDRIKFLGALHAVRYAAAKDTTRPSLMMIDVSGGKMTACDGVRFQQADLGEDFPLSLRIPTGAIGDLVKLLNSTDLPQIGIGESENYLIFKVGRDVFIANKLMAQFPDMEQLLLRPALENKHELLADRQELVDAIKRVRINADAETSAIELGLTKGKLTVRAADKIGNEAREELDVKWDAGERSLVVNHGFLAEMLAMYDGKSCFFLLGEDTKSRKSPLMLRDDETGTVGIVQQMVSDWVGYAKK